MVKDLTLLGSTGSIGAKAAKICKLHGIRVHALTASVNYELLEKQARYFKPRKVALLSENSAKELKLRLSDTDIKVLSGIEGISECAVLEESNTVLNSIVGIAGLVPTLDAIEAGKNIALANKETMVAGGTLVKKLAEEKNVKIYPVDTEHSAIYQCLSGKKPNSQVKRLILTASGGAFFGKKRDELKDVTISEALNHPNWSMGQKITIDSATMMNKGLEIIEAVHLFDVDESKIDVLIHPQSIVHSMVEFCDGAIMAQLGPVDTGLAIQYSLTAPDRLPSFYDSLTFEQITKIEFLKPDNDTFDAMDICREAIRRGGLYPASLNAANEMANMLFRQNKISFLDISYLSAKAMEKTENKENFTLLDVLAADRIAREYVKEEAIKR
ncbi:MAG: 1-deoxy-D-xylulose-5-phosphate reductoisomerase [Clostridia bacterium]|nr:1-deoxy-D-xylulose-5-phosphate reductoisomerase [Clostridia bacterium]